MSRACWGVVLGLVLVLAGAGTHAEETLAGAVEAYLRPLAQQQAFTGTVLVSSGDAVRVHAGFGEANRFRNRPNDVNTRFRCGSITKTFTAIAILQLRDAGRLRLDDPVAEHLGWFPEDGGREQITIRHLLTHTSGIGDYTGDRNSAFGFDLSDLPLLVGLHTPTGSWGRRLQMQQVLSRPLFHAPGERFSYSNPGYVLLGMIIERCSGQSYFDYVAQHVLEPAGMTRSDFDRCRFCSRGWANGYARLLGRLIPTGFEIHPTAIHGAGALYTTTTDMLAWQRALFEVETLLSTASRDELVEPRVSAPGASGDRQYGYGVMIETYLGRTRLSHGGSLVGFLSVYHYYPEDDLFIVVLENQGALVSSSGGVGAVVVAERIAELVFQ